MLTSKFLTASLTALAVVGSAGFVYAQSTSGAVTPAPASGDTTTPAMNQDVPAMDQPLARADRN